MTTHTSVATRDIVVTGRVAAVAGIAGPVLFTLAFTAQGLFRQDEYDPVAETVSALEAGPGGWIQQANFVWLAVCLALLAVGLQRGIRSPRLRRASAVLLGLMSLGAVLAAVLPLREDASGATHDPGGHFVAGVTFFLCTALSLLVLSRRMRDDDRWANLSRYTAVAGIVGLCCFVLLGAFAVPEDAPLHDYAGLLQRLTVVLVLFPCLVVLAVRLRRLSTR